MVLGIGGDNKAYDYDVEVIEVRMGTYSKWDTKARVIRDKEALVPSYDVKGIPRLIPVPDYSHTFVTRKGRAIKLFSPDPDTYILIKFNPSKVELGTTKDEYIKNWFNFKVKQAHERWTKSTGWDKWLPLIMLFIVGLVFIVGMRFSTESAQKSAEATAAMGTFVADKLQSSTADMKEAIQSCKGIIQLYNDIIEQNKGELAKPLQPPPA